MVIWITGLSGSGKSTLCNALYALMKPSGRPLVKLDGDEIRAVFGEDLGYREEDRMRQIGRIQRLAKLLADHGIDVLVAALYANPELLAWNRANLPGYFEIYIEAGIDFLTPRNPKDLYGRARRGEIADVVGHDIPWHAPAKPDLLIRADQAPAPEVLAADVLHKIAHLL